MRKKIIGVSVVFMVLAMICAQPVLAAQVVTVNAWTDKPYYDPGEKGKLQVSLLNELDIPIEIHNISVTYPWGPRYDANKGAWEGNETIEGQPIANVASKGGKYYKEMDFTVPSDGGAAGGVITIAVGTTNGTITVFAGMLVTGTGLLGVLPTKIIGLDTWMTSAAVFILICTIILAIAIFLAARRARGPRMIAPPPRSKAKAG